MSKQGLLSLVPLCLLLSLFIFFGIHFFKSFPDGWDYAEYAWCIRSNYFPHSPYIFFFLTGRFFHLFFDPALSLSLISFVSGTASLILFYKINLQFEQPVLSSLAATSVLGFSHLFITQSGVQEVYVFQTFLILLSLFFIASNLKKKVIYSGLIFGCALAAHNASFFVLPALLFLLCWKEKKGTAKACFQWILLSLLTLSIFYFFVYLVLPEKPSELPYGDLFIRYLRGIAPSPSLHNLWQPGFLLHSLQDFFHRLSLYSIPVSSEAPQSIGPTGLGIFHFLILFVGGIICAGRNFKIFLFWILYAAFYFAYEVTLGFNLDVGLYIPFLLFPSAFFIGYAVNILGEKSKVLPCLVVIFLIYGEASLLGNHWKDAEKDRLRHFSPSTLMAIWSSKNLPQDAILIQPYAEWNVNIFPYYADRRHILRNAEGLALFEPRGPYTPMNGGAYEPLTTVRLRALLESGHSVYSFDQDPLGRSNPAVLDQSQFQWEIQPSELGPLYRAKLVE